MKIKSPYLIIIASFLLLILLGSILFCLPVSVNEGAMSYIDALFLSVSAVCVTGLSTVVNLGVTLSVFGKVVLAILIEVGGISILTLASFIYIIIGKKMTINNEFVLKEALNQDSAKDISRLIKRIMLFSIIIQVLGALINLIVFVPMYGSKGIGISIFHAISSFNNAGIDIFGEANSMISFANNVLLNINTMLLIILGGIGFVVLSDVFLREKGNILSLHTKIVLIMTGTLIVVGTLVFKLSMYDEITWLQAIFWSVTSRTAGFTTVELSNISNASYIMSNILMIIGASPCSTGGGIKTTTTFIAVISIIYYAQGKKVRFGHREIPRQTCYKAILLLVVSAVYLCVASIVLSFAQPNMQLDNLIFELCSAFSTAGLSQGITPYLNTFGKIVIIITMFVGRLGPMTLINIGNKNWFIGQKEEEVKYLTENVIVG